MSTTTPVRRANRRVRAAWISVALVPVGFVLAFFVGEGLLTAQGYDSTDTSIPAGAVLLSAVPAIVVMLAPCAAAFALGWSARDVDPRGRAPALVGVVLGSVFVVLNLAGLLARIVAG
ncbi:MAG TPA: hypothetical protein VFM09_12250 [Marmoricola sp.]|nr:hypothetical protein [Marmoricola sp.]